jgi:predicted metal-dependent hydrolase
MSETAGEAPRDHTDRLWPAYAFVPGRGLPHPVADPAGHLYGQELATEPIDPARWRDCRAYLRGVDLFNRGYYWEAHEAWEGVWRCYDRAQIPALFLQGLIKLAAAGVKVREGVPIGVASLAAGAASHFREVRDRVANEDVYCGLSLTELDAAARQIEQTASAFPSDKDRGPRVVFDILLRPGGPAS